MNQALPDHELMDLIFQTARRLYEEGGGYGQQAAVLREVKKQLAPRGRIEEQVILALWHRLFLDGKLAWGLDLDNPGPPWYHVPEHVHLDAPPLVAR